MSTKNLARTILEAGRVAKHYRCKRREVTRKQRTRLRAYMARAGNSADLFDAEPIYEPRRNRGPQADKLGAPRRWLRSQVGRPWVKVEAEMLSKFSPRTLAGRHIVFEHLLREVNFNGERKSGHKGLFVFYVDERGFLRAEPRRTPKHQQQ